MSQGTQQRRWILQRLGTEFGNIWHRQHYIVLHRSKRIHTYKPLLESLEEHSAPTGLSVTAGGLLIPEIVFPLQSLN